MATPAGEECWFRTDLPPPVSETYEPRGTWEDTGALKSCKWLDFMIQMSS